MLEKPQKSVLQANISSGSTSKPSSRPRPPALHITKPSIDHRDARAPPSAFTMTSIPSTAQTIISSSDIHSSSFRTALQSASSADYAATQARDDAVFAGDCKAREEEQESKPVTNGVKAYKGVPKRKSLSGLFGLNLKKSLDNVRSSSALAVLASNPFPITWDNMDKPDVQPILGPVSEGRSKNASPPLPQLQASLPYKSRFGDEVTRCDVQTSTADGECDHASALTDAS